MSVKAAIQELEAATSEEDILFRRLAKKHDICWLTLARQVKGIYALRQDDALK
jgi:hypothetical protein